jgi:hypothetical protein
VIDCRWQDNTLDPNTNTSFPLFYRLFGCLCVCQVGEVWASSPSKADRSRFDACRDFRGSYITTTLITSRLVGTLLYPSQQNDQVLMHELLSISPSLLPLCDKVKWDFWILLDAGQPAAPRYETITRLSPSLLPSYTLIANLAHNHNN